MEKKFKSNIKCEACVAKVEDALNAMETISSWKVDLQSPNRELSINGEASIEEINTKLEPLGYSVSEG